jgi:diguanylate cyclase (GGDEF)-like protein
LPGRLGFTQIAVYVHDDEQSILTLAETNSDACIDLSIPTDDDSNHFLAEIARSNLPLVTDDLISTCDANGWSCPPNLTQVTARAAAVLPLGENGKIGGVILLIDRAPDATAGATPLDCVAKFLSRRLNHARLYVRARREARVDRLTGLFNDRWMTESLDREIRRAQRFNSPLSLIMLDLDGLKLVNDRLGHLAGDALIRHVARKISAALRQIDSAARIGGDEFIVLLPSTNAAGAKRVATRIQRAIRSDSPVIEGRYVPVSASLGFAQWQSGWDARTLREAADKAMYVAKTARRPASRPKSASALLAQAPAPPPTPTDPTILPQPS